MHAIVRRNTFDPQKLEGATDTLVEFRRLHASQPGYQGSIEIEVTRRDRVVVNLWTTEEDAMAAMQALVPHVERLLNPLMTRPSELIGAGSVKFVDLVRQG